jgi:hypothetical protein
VTACAALLVSAGTASKPPCCLDCLEPLTKPFLRPLHHHTCPHPLSAVSQQFEESIRPFQNWRSPGPDKLVELKVFVRREGWVFRDVLTWDLSCALSTPERYAATVVADLRLDPGWYDPLVAYLQQRLTEARQVRREGGGRVCWGMVAAFLQAPCTHSARCHSMPIESWCGLDGTAGQNNHGVTSGCCWCVSTGVAAAPS